jgi:hypothetical protein
MRRKPVNPKEALENKVRFNRRFDTCDENDFPFHNGTIHLYWMRGSSPLNLENDIDAPKSEDIEQGSKLVQLLRTDSVDINEE